MLDERVELRRRGFRYIALAADTVLFTQITMEAAEGRQVPFSSWREARTRDGLAAFR